jgi:hypothetical protein
MSDTVNHYSGEYQGVIFTEPQNYFAPSGSTLYGTQAQEISYQEPFNGPPYTARGKSDINGNESEIKKVYCAGVQPGQDPWETQCTVLTGPIRIEYTNGNNKEFTEADQTWLYHNKTLYDYSARVRIFKNGDGSNVEIPKAKSGGCTLESRKKPVPSVGTAEA